MKLRIEVVQQDGKNAFRYAFIDSSGRFVFVKILEGGNSNLQVDNFMDKLMGILR